MKKYVLSTILSLILICALGISAQSAIMVMPDGENFDPEYYARNNPDVVKALGNDADRLYEHYVSCGKAEGRVAYNKAAGSKPTIKKDNPNTTGYDVIAIIGDSRCCGLVDAIWVDGTWKHILRNYTDDIKFEGAYQKNNTIIVICAEGGGSYWNGAQDRTMRRLNELLKEVPCLGNCRSYQFFNLFGLNDMCDKDIKKVPPGIIRFDEKQLMTGKFNRVFQVNVGPISDKGQVWQEYYTNENIETFNDMFPSSNKVIIADLYSYLTDKGYTCIINEADPRGVHYDIETTMNILEYILTLATP